MRFLRAMSLRGSFQGSQQPAPIPELDHRRFVGVSEASDVHGRVIVGADSGCQRLALHSAAICVTRRVVLRM